MSNIFFIHTPMQLYIAQQVIMQEKLLNNVMLYSYIESNCHFLKIYESIILNRFWKKKIFFKNIDSWALLSRKNPFSSFYNVVYKYLKLRNILKNEHANSIYLGDISNISYQFLIKLFSRKYEINIYEEGMNHYIYKKLNIKSKNKFIEGIILDFLFYLPIFHIRFSKYLYRNSDLSLLNIANRFSILPGIHQEKYDHILRVNFDLISPKIKILITLELNKNQIEIDKPKILFLLNPIYELGDSKSRNRRYNCYLKTIEGALKSLKNEYLLIKFHPRQSLQEKNQILKIIKKYVNFSVFGENINIPVEFYLQSVNISKIYGIYNSTFCYNGFLYSRRKIVDISQEYFDICEEEHIYIDEIKNLYCYVKNLIDYEILYKHENKMIN